MIELILSIGASIVSGVTLFIVRRVVNKKDKMEKAEQKAKQQENIIILKSINAIGKLSNASAIALRDGKINGKMKSAMEAYEEIEGELYEYLLEQNSKKN